jgi:hypothetical protein
MAINNKTIPLNNDPLSRFPHGGNACFTIPQGKGWDDDKF